MPWKPFMDGMDYVWDPIRSIGQPSLAYRKCHVAAAAVVGSETLQSDHFPKDKKSPQGGIIMNDNNDLVEYNKVKRGPTTTATTTHYRYTVSLLDLFQRFQLGCGSGRGFHHVQFPFGQYQIRTMMVKTTK